MYAKKILIIFTLFALLSSAVMPQINATKEKTTGIFDNLRIYNFNTTTEIEIKNIPEDPLEIDSDNEIPITIGFKYENPRFYPSFLTNLVGGWILFRDNNRNMTVNVSILLTTPEWVTGDMVKEELTIPLSTTLQTKDTKLNFKIKNETEAFKDGKISLKAEFTPEENWGLEASEASASFDITPEYQGSIDVNYTYPDNDTKINTKPGENISIPVRIKNTGNGETRATLTLNSLNDNINVSIVPETIIIPKNAEKTIILNFSVSKRKESYMKTLNFTVNSESTTEKELDSEFTEGETEVFSIDIKVEKPKEENGFDNLLLILGILIVILVLIGIIIRFLKKR